jgi:hypothetical protein
MQLCNSQAHTWPNFCPFSSFNSRNSCRMQGDIQLAAQTRILLQSVSHKHFHWQWCQYATDEPRRASTQALRVVRPKRRLSLVTTHPQFIYVYP